MAGFGMAFHLGHALARRPVPEDRAAAFVETVKTPGMFGGIVYRINVAVQPGPQRGFAVGADGCGQVNAILPHDRTGEPQTWNCRLPTDIAVAGDVPGERWELTVADSRS